VLAQASWLRNSFVGVSGASVTGHALDSVGNFYMQPNLREPIL
jgi:hypothetical protein